MKIPAGSGMWPAFWLAWYPGIKYWQEIDIMEWVGSDPHNIFTTYHWSQDGIVNHQGSGTATYGPDWTSGWHTFGVDWQLDKIVWYLDGKAVKTLVQGVTIHDLRHTRPVGAGAGEKKSQAWCENT
jgi:beta-glucanase (GH16 family)